jgi:hypothetical protein
VYGAAMSVEAATSRSSKLLIPLPACADLRNSWLTSRRVGSTW